MEVYCHLALRQKMWKTQIKQIKIVKNRKKIICPYNHTFVDYTNKNTDVRGARTFASIKINTYVLINEGAFVLLVKTLSNIKWEMCDDMRVIRKCLKNCEHTYLKTNLECIKCEKSVVRIENKSTMDDNILNELKDDETVEDLYTCYIDVEIIQEFHKDKINYGFRTPQSIYRINHPDGVKLTLS